MQRQHKKDHDEIQLKLNQHTRSAQERRKEVREDLVQKMYEADILRGQTKRVRFCLPPTHSYRSSAAPSVEVVIVCEASRHLSLKFQKQYETVVNFVSFRMFL